MPIVSATGATAVVMCVVCGAEQTVLPPQWMVSDTDDSVLTAPPCPGCDSTETFSWHDWVYVGPDKEPNPNHFGAKQMVLIERVAQARGRSKASRNPNREYPSAPQAPTPAEVRAYRRPD